MMLEGACRVLIVNESAVIRGLWVKLLQDRNIAAFMSTVPDLGTAMAGLKSRAAVDFIIVDASPLKSEDVLVLSQFGEAAPSARIIFISPDTPEGKRTQAQVASLGVECVLEKPSLATPRESIEAIGSKVCSVLRPASLRSKALGLERKPEALIIGSSTGGPNALAELLTAIDPSIQLPIFIVQHILDQFTQDLAERIGKVSGRPCLEANDGDIALPGKIYLARGGRHLVLNKEKRGVCLNLLDTLPVNYCRPAVDPLFESAALIYGERLLAIILTGMGEDGRRGCECVAKAGGVVVAQDEPSSVVWGMPGAVVKAGLARYILPLKDIRAQLPSLCAGRG